MKKLKKVIVDCDPGIDDTLALLSLIKSNKLDIIGISLVSGNVCTSKSLLNVVKLYQFLLSTNFDKNKLPPIYVGQDFPIKRNRIDAEDTHGSDGLSDANFDSLFDNEFEKNFIYDKLINPYKNTNAVDFMVDIASKLKGTVDIIELGPLTNIAKAIEKDNLFIKNINKLYIMGGTFISYGNCSPSAEFNFFSDPDAAKLVFLNKYSFKKNKLTLFPLDVTRKIVLTYEIIDFIKEHIDQKIGLFIEKVTRFYMSFHKEYEQIDGCVINDPLIVEAYIDSFYNEYKIIKSSFNSFVDIETNKESICYGKSVVDYLNFYKKDSNCKIIQKIKEKEFFYSFIAHISGMTRKEIEIKLLSKEIDFNYKYPYKLYF